MRLSRSSALLWFAAYCLPCFWLAAPIHSNWFADYDSVFNAGDHVMKVEIEIDVPEGFEYVRFGQVNEGEWYWTGYEVGQWQGFGPHGNKNLVFKQVPKIEIPDNLKPGWMWKVIDYMTGEDSWVWSPEKPTWNECVKTFGSNGPTRNISFILDMPEQPSCSIRDSLAEVK